MARSSSPSNPIQPLDVGSVVSAAFRLYRENAKEYLKISGAATLWLLLPLLLAIVIFVLVALQGSPALLGLGVPIILVLGIFAFTKYLANSALISRRGFNILTNQPEPLETSQRFTDSRAWNFLLVGLLLGIIFTGIFLGLFIGFFVITLVVGVGAGGAGSFGSSTAPLAVLLVVLLALVLMIPIFAILMWLSARLSTIAEVPLAVEQESGPLRSISRSWDLTQGSAWRIVLILIVAGAVTIPFQLAALPLTFISDRIITTIAPEGTRNYETISSLVSQVFSLLVSILVLPFWQSIKAVLYYDLRNRREGLGLQLRDRD